MFLLKVINNFINSRGATEDRTRDSCVQGKCVSHLYHSPIFCERCRIRTYDLLRVKQLL
jgi:hypothetical protein